MADSLPDPVTDDAERELGITEYLSPGVSGFSAVLKARYSDFCVHEGTFLTGRSVCRLPILTLFDSSGLGWKRCALDKYRSQDYECGKRQWRS